VSQEAAFHHDAIERITHQEYRPHRENDQGFSLNGHFNLFLQRNLLAQAAALNFRKSRRV
jgi:hypothetical protein